LLENNEYEIFHTEDDNDEKFLDINFNHIYVYGIKIKLLEYSNPTDKFFTINSVKAFR